MSNLTVCSRRNLRLVSDSGRAVRVRTLHLRRSILSMALPMLLLAGCTFQPILPDGSPTPTPIIPPPIVATLTATTPPLLVETISSPDGQWRTQVMIYVCTQIEDQGEVSYEELSLINVATGTQVEIAHQQINCGGLGAFGLAPLCWSPDSRILHFTDAREGVPDGAGEWQRPIYQYDRTTEEVQPYGGDLKPTEPAQLPMPVGCAG